MPFVPSKNSIANASRRSNDLTRDVDESGDERAKVHGEKAATLLEMSGSPPRGDRYEQRDPGLQ